MSRLTITFKRIISAVMLLTVVRVEPTEEQFNAERESLRNAVDNMIKADNMLYEQKAKIIIQDNFQIQGVFLNAISLS